MTYVIRVDASPEIGTGHLMRCIALGQALREGGRETAFVTRTTDPVLLGRLASESFEVVGEIESDRCGDAQRTAAIASEYSAPWVVVDGYHFDVGYQRLLRPHVDRLLCVDDFAQPGYHCDAVLNQNLHALSDASYAALRHLRLMLGPRYALLRREFVTMRQHRRVTGSHRVLVTMGGSDLPNGTLRVLKALEMIGDSKLEVRTVLGSSNPNTATISEFVGSASLRVEVMESAASMVQHMQWADLCVTAGGSTCWECCYLGLPMAVGVIAVNQEPIAESLESYGAAVNLGRLDNVSLEALSSPIGTWLSDGLTRETAGERARQLVDGRGAQRVAETLIDLEHSDLRGVA